MFRIDILYLITYTCRYRYWIILNTSSKRMPIVQKWKTGCLSVLRLCLPAWVQMGWISNQKLSMLLLDLHIHAPLLGHTEHMYIFGSLLAGWALAMASKLNPRFDVPLSWSALFHMKPPQKECWSPDPLHFLLNSTHIPKKMVPSGNSTWPWKMDHL